MKLSHTVFLSVTMWCPITSIVMQNPTGSNCWDSTLAIINSEIQTIYNQELYNTQRTYVMCSGPLTIGTLSSGAVPLPVGGDFPLVIINPNVHIKCELAYSCSFTGGATAHVTTLENNTLVESFLAFNGIPGGLPEGYFVDSSNLLVEGMTFTGMEDILGDQYAACPFVFNGFGVNMEIRNCFVSMWNPDVSLPPAFAFAMNFYNNYAFPDDNRTYAASVTIRDSIFTGNILRWSIFRTSVFNNDKDAPLLNVVLDNVIVRDNRVQDDAESLCTCTNFGAISALDTHFVINNSIIDKNVLVTGYAPINLIGASQLEWINSTLVNTAVTNKTSGDCGDVAIISKSKAALTFPLQPGDIELDSCIDDLGDDASYEPPTYVFAGACFSGGMTLATPQGLVLMEDLKLGDMVLVEKGGNFEPVYSFGHRSNTIKATFLRFEPLGLEVTKDHLVFVDGRAIPASTIQVGDSLNGQLVTFIANVNRQGVYAPFTPSGKIVVQGVKASCYVTFQEDSAFVHLGPDLATPFTFHWMAHSGLYPLRFACVALGLCSEESYTMDGISTRIATPCQYVLWLFGNNKTSSSTLIMIFARAFVAIMGITFWLIETFGVSFIALSGGAVALFFSFRMILIRIKY